MGHEAIELELIEWLTKLDDDETIQSQKVIETQKINTPIGGMT